MTARTIFAVMLVVSLVGISACDFLAREWKTGILGCLFAAANIIIFLWR